MCLALCRSRTTADVTIRVPGWETRGAMWCGPNCSGEVDSRTGRDQKGTSVTVCGLICRTDGESQGTVVLSVPERVRGHSEHAETHRRDTGPRHGQKVSAVRGQG